MYLLDVSIRDLKYFCVLFVLFVFLFMLLALLRCYTSILDGFIYCWINLLPRLWKSQERHKDYRWTAHRGKSKHAASFTGYIYLVNDDPMIFLQLLKIVLSSTFFTLTYFHHFPFLKLPTVIFTPLSLAPIAAALAGGSLSPHTWFSKWNFPLLRDLNY